MPVRLLAKLSHKPRRRRDKAHVGRDRLSQDRGHIAVCERRSKGSRVVPRHDSGVGGLSRGDAGARRDRLRCQARAGLGQQAVNVAVVGAGELDDPIATGRCPGEPYRAHRSLGPRRRHPQHLDRVEALADVRGQLDLALGRRSVAGAAGGRFADGVHHVRVGMPQHQRAPGGDPVDVAMAIDVDQLEACAALDEDRVLASNRSHCPNRGVHPARQQADGAGIN